MVGGRARRSSRPPGSARRCQPWRNHDPSARDEPHATILIACTKCDWKAAFNRDELIAQHGAACPLPELLSLVTAPGCSRVGSQWDRCGAYYVEPIEGA
jgi:hypothetical protein